jgi:alpha-L-rhamnosidase
MACSAYCAGYLLQALYDGGQAQAALTLLTADTTASWRNMIAQGAGSTMEAWTPALKPNLTYSHPWSASPAYIVPDYLFGVRALLPGYQSVLIHPQTASLTRGAATVPTPRGPVMVTFTRAAGNYTAQVDLPATATGQVALPGVRAGQRVWVDGAARTTAAGKAGTAAAGLAVVAVGSGWHKVASAP